MNQNRSRGFTLIELLVVIAIIGILSAVVLSSMNTARSKGQDATIISDMTGIRTQAELYRSDHNNTYGAAATADCTAGVFGDATVTKQLTGVKDASGNSAIICNISTGGKAYAASAQLVADPNLYFCVDSTGVATTTGKTGKDLPSGAVTCPS